MAFNDGWKQNLNFLTNHAWSFKNRDLFRFCYENPCHYDLRIIHFCCNLFLFFVQLLTMRNGVSLYPMCLPGILQSNEISHMRMGYSEGRSRSLNVNNMTRATTSLDQTTAPSNNIMFTLPGHYPNQEQTSSIPNLRKLSDSDSFGLGSSTQVHSESFQLQIPGSSKVSSVWWINHTIKKLFYGGSFRIFAPKNLPSSLIHI